MSAPRPEELPAVEIAGVPVRCVTFDGCLTLCEQAIRGRKVLQVTTCNLDFLLKAQTDLRFKDLLCRTLNVADGMPLVWLSKVLGSPLPGRVNGTNLVEALCRRAGEQGWTVYLLGADEEVNREAQHRLARRYPGLQVHGSSPLVGLGDEAANRAIAAEIAGSGAHIVLTALGAPRQEVWLARYLSDTGAFVGLGVGGALDLIAGKYRRAPGWMQRSGLEWLFRLLQQPAWLWRRYLQDGIFFLRLLMRSLTARPKSERVR